MIRGQQSSYDITFFIRAVVPYRLTCSPHIREDALAEVPLQEGVSRTAFTILSCWEAHIFPAVTKVIVIKSVNPIIGLRINFTSQNLDSQGGYGVILSNKKWRDFNLRVYCKGM
ncbi:hypothetical protein TWF192_007331 [Orbilia oligospora]|uniref:Uncharacterized protein n=1 Tax=Orbilia oligospora TaxID=2813651 RepID=A0A6G1M503_ORBOL|nr:hypothetical protein TWF679_003296 [Orbilia oligospora]KAF3245857.1 hypothetical protein TWF192_007331 [Orbilia oligospora]